MDQIKNQPEDLLVNTSSGNLILFAGYRPAQNFVIERSLCTHRFGWSTQFSTIVIIQFTSTVLCLQIIQWWCYTVHFSYLLPGFMLVVCNSNVNQKFVQLHYFFPQTIGGQKKLYPPCPKVVGICPHSPPLNSVPGRNKSHACISCKFIQR